MIGTTPGPFLRARHRRIQRTLFLQIRFGSGISGCGHLSNREPGQPGRNQRGSYARAESGQGAHKQDGRRAFLLCMRFQRRRVMALLGLSIRGLEVALKAGLWPRCREIQAIAMSAAGMIVRWAISEGRPRMIGFNDFSGHKIVAGHARLHFNSR